MWATDVTDGRWAEHVILPDRLKEFLHTHNIMVC